MEEIDGFEAWRALYEKVKLIKPEIIEKYLLENSTYKFKDEWGIWHRYDNPEEGRGINVIFIPWTYPNGQYEDFCDDLVDMIMEISKFIGKSDDEIVEKLFEMQG